MFLKVVLLTMSLLIIVQSRSVDRSNIRSDVIVTHYVPEEQPPTNGQKRAVPIADDDGTGALPVDDDNPKKPGWMRAQLMRFGDITSRVSNSLGGSAMKIAAVVEKLCKMLKTVIPIVAAVCNVGQFQFCTAADAPAQLSEVLNRPMNTMDLSTLDK